MQNEILSDKQGISLIVLFIMGSSLILTTADSRKRFMVRYYFINFNCITNSTCPCKTSSTFS